MSQNKHTGNISPEFALLGFLIHGASHGYDLHQRCIVELGHIWHMSQSQAYAILKRLEQRGDVNAQVVEQNKLPARQMLRITAQGRRRFNEWLEEVSINSRSIRLEFLTRLYFARIYKPEKVEQIHETQYNEIKASVERLETLLANLPPEQQFNQLSLDLRLRQMVLIQEWMRDVKSQIIDSKE
jgi:PadR family transcriptional regulator, regulatory protein AphA